MESVAVANIQKKNAVFHMKRAGCVCIVHFHNTKQMARLHENFIPFLNYAEIFESFTWTDL